MAKIKKALCYSYIFIKIWVLLTGKKNPALRAGFSLLSDQDYLTLTTSTFDKLQNSF
jgi:hypothetical protein